MAKSISELIIEYFQKHPRKDLQHAPVVDWITKQYLKDNSESSRDPWRTIRKLHQEGKLIKVKKGVYRYDPDCIKEVELWDFPANAKEKIFNVIIINVLYVVEEKQMALNYAQII